MELIRRNSDYALRSLVFMSRFPKDNKLAIKTIAQKQNLSVIFLRKIFQKLTKRKIVQSQRGRKGGFSLLKKPSEISLREILESVQGRISLSDCLFESNACSRRRSCRIKLGLSSIQKKLITLLDRYTLDGFIKIK